MKIQICMHPFFGDIPMMEFFIFLHPAMNEIHCEEWKPFRKISFFVLLTFNSIFDNFQN
jgi:hypothetical protein